MPRGLGQVDGRGRALAPAERGPSAEGFEDSLRQRDVSRQGGMVAVVERVVVEDAVGTDPPQYGQAIDQDAAVPPRHRAIGLLQRRRAAYRIAVAVAGQDVVPVRLGVGAPALEQSPARRWASANSGFRSRIARYPASASAGSRASVARAVSKARVNSARIGLRNRVGKHRAVGLETSFVAGRDHEHRHAADPLAVADDRLEPALEVGHDRGEFRRGHAGRVDQVVLVQGGRRPAQAVLAHRLVDQAAERRGETEPVEPVQDRVERRFLQPGVARLS